MNAIVVAVAKRRVIRGSFAPYALLKRSLPLVLPANADEFTWDARPNKSQIAAGRDHHGAGSPEFGCYTYAL